MTRHRRTDPACVNYSAPKHGSWRDRRSRGRCCLTCLAAARDRIAVEVAAANEKLAETRDSLVANASSLLDQALDRLASDRAQHGQIERPQL